MNNIYLVGLPGCGKSTVGKLLSEDMKLEFVDTDEKIVEKAGCPINEIFREKGEEHFRKLETEALADASGGFGRVISTGGGIILKKENVDLMKKNGVVFYIKRDAEKILRGNLCDRPLLKDDKNKLFELEKKREKLYLSACDYIAENNSDLERVIDEIKKHTVSLGILGCPLGHSFSPKIHSYLSSRKNLFCNYKKFEMKSDELKSFVNFIKSGAFKGFNITIPYKRDIMDYLDYTDDYAKSCGAVNTVKIKNGRLYGYNTDGRGFCLALKKSGVDIEGKKILFIGFGGAAKGILYSLKKENCGRVSALCRTVKEINGVKCAELNDSNLKIYAENADIIINATPLGMKNYSADFESFDFLEDFGGVVCDIVYNPLKTRLIKEAEKKDIKTVNGLYMLIYQGILSFEIFTSLDFDLEETAEKLYNMLKTQL